jgi:hypothetical protein
MASGEVPGLAGQLVGLATANIRMFIRDGHAVVEMAWSKVESNDSVQPSDRRE